MTIVDTSFLIALQDADDHFHAEAKETPLYGDALLIPWEIWVEYSQALLRRLPARIAEVQMSNILSGPFQIRAFLSAPDLVEIARRHPAIQERIRKMGRKPLSLFDLAVLFVAAQRRDSILTFDEGIRAAVRAKMFPGARIA